MCNCGRNKQRVLPKINNNLTTPQNVVNQKVALSQAAAQQQMNFDAQRQLNYRRNQVNKMYQ